MTHRSGSRTARRLVAGSFLLLAAFAASSRAALAAAQGRVLDVLADYGAAGDGVTDDHAAIQAAILAAAPGDTVYFPPTAGGYRIASGSTLVVPARDLTLLGDGWTSGGAPTPANGGATGSFSGSRLLRTEPVPRGAMLQLAGDVVVDGLHLDGGLYGRYGVDPDAEGILCWGSGFGAQSDVTVRNCLIENFTTRALAVNGTDDGFVENCLFRRCDLGGAYLSRVRRWQLRSCAAVDIGDSPRPGSPYGNHYPFVVTADPGGASSEDALFLDCLVDHAPNWVGMLDHGTLRSWLTAAAWSTPAAESTTRPMSTTRSARTSTM
jgi:hypothetical protein